MDDNITTTPSPFEVIEQVISSETIDPQDVESMRLALLFLKDQIDVVKHEIEFAKLNGDSFFLVVNSVFILMMQAGFSFFECGSVRSKNVVNMLLKNTLDAFIGGFCYWACGFAFAFGEPSTPFIGTGYFFFYSMPSNLFAKWFFHYSFCVTAATIVSGAVAERCDFGAYLCYTVVISSLTYPVISHWAWHTDIDPAKQGWLVTLGYQDFAGSGVVHMTGGMCALVAALCLGARYKKYKHTEDHETEEMLPHNIPLMTLGAFLLFVGFFAFNGGSQASISVPLDGESTGKAMVNTILAASPASFCGTMLSRIFNKRRTFSLVDTLGSGLGGMVAICAGCNRVEGWAAAIIGFCSAFFFFSTSRFLKRMHIDDPVDAVAVHLACGFWGVVATALFDNHQGLFTTWSLGGLKLLGINILGALCIAAWCVATTLPIFFGLKMLKVLRVSQEAEELGLDFVKHGEVAYTDCAWAMHSIMEEGLSEEAKLYLKELLANTERNSRLRKRKSTSKVQDVQDRVVESETASARDTTPNSTGV